MRRKGRDTYVLSTGREFYANRGLISINELGEIAEGYDGGIQLECEWDEEFQPWTKDERREFADYMIRLWTQFRNDANGD